MGSVVVVLPASICAAMPIFRVLSRLYSLAIPVAFSRTNVADMYSLLYSLTYLPPVVSERLVRFGHLVAIFLLLNARAGVVRRIHQFRGESLAHCTAGSLP